MASPPAVKVVLRPTSPEGIRAYSSNRLNQRATSPRPVNLDGRGIFVRTTATAGAGLLLVLGSVTPPCEPLLLSTPDTNCKLISHSMRLKECQLHNVHEQTIINARSTCSTAQALIIRILHIHQWHYWKSR